jgi:hypothetical protein
MKFLLLGIRGLHYFGRIVHGYQKNGTRLETLYRKKKGKSNFFSLFLRFPFIPWENLCEQGVDFLIFCLYTRDLKGVENITYNKDRTLQGGY